MDGNAKKDREGRRIRRPFFLLRWIMAKENGYARWIIGMAMGMVYVYIFYEFLVAPIALRWRGVYGEDSFPEGYSIRGIDISHHQGQINWDLLPKAKIGDEPVAFVFIKATEGETLVDSRFAYNFKEAGNAGLIRGAYHFFSPSVSAKAQVAHFLNCVTLEPGDLPPVLDIELTGKLSPEELRRKALYWLRAMERVYGVPPILYTNYSFKQKYLNTPEFDRYPYWIAHYYVKDLRYEGKWHFWQHTDNGYLKGIKGDVDLNLFNGSFYRLNKLTIPDSVRPGGFR